MKYLLLIFIPFILLSQTKYNSYNKYNSYIKESSTFVVNDSYVIGLWQGTYGIDTTTMTNLGLSGGIDLTQSTAAKQADFTLDVGWTFNGSSDYYKDNTGSGAVYPAFDSSDFTIDVYMSSTDFDDYSWFISRGYGTVDSCWIMGMRADTSKWVFWANNNGWVSCSGVVLPNVDYLCTVVRQDSAIYLYQNGVQVGYDNNYFSGAHLMVNSDGSNAIRVGSRHLESHYFIGTIHEIRISNKARTQTETLNYYNDLADRY